MDRDIAESLMAIYERMGTNMNEANELLRRLPEEQRREHVRALGTMMQDLWLNLQLPIVREHRDLDAGGTRYQRSRE
jgi:hypothetical protein